MRMLIKTFHPKWKLLKLPPNFIQLCSTNINSPSIKDKNDEDFKDWKEKLHSTMAIYENFITEYEEKSLLNEVEPYLKRMRYEYAHWDNMIHGYRETEFPKWNEENSKIITKIRKKAFPPDMPQLGLVHVLDLAEDGWIKPHVDSSRFCGEIIATISLLSESIMRLTCVGHEKEYWDDFFIPRRSLYIMKGVARHKYNHEILSKQESIYQGKPINKLRRISIICRSEPE
ncbi:alpha-ketoglutarate-dependent dioxygenase alkB homolog 7, mitochondrial [Phymastichus coffea]|uniref:alpha-ketoglutarate-dependent dioxygenase alkB homolog 7, mitochondrial n=1 Tax=Phymastichus coffea TaxID=108790 RepID=UPI00273AA15C|nr:alpha-ketoglutarate-dependent dioxygenase alkB homolog 7, mitochondrial [Phymastichus coffea]XP_058802665.1 alpha-ketoglutarate-dependent dioxygenase alkB homolog 7, mitochondrial [Phymastichus coffea]XP_058802667.1 alpha-ketoglutarate-dependent dioxygenase alkB homolog 7, mitochondrial [Phymastichus coffea]XP_058802668.1 alpha-ketoglutarate-dependent dioxygenase alkB homolog 7, mitochondrial [Phymastichus coffea]